MADEIRGNQSVNASQDAASVFYLLKIRTRDDLGERDANGDPVSYFDVEDIGAIQSTALLQDFNNNEFVEIPGNPNVDWIDGTTNWGGLITENLAGSNKGRILIPEVTIPNTPIIVPRFEAEWDIDAADDRVTEINAATAIKDVFNGPNVASVNIAAGTFNYASGGGGMSADALWGFYGKKIKDILREALPVFIDVQNHTDLTNILDDIINNTSYLNLPGSDTRFVNNAQSSNVIEALNKMYGPNTAAQENTINPIDGSIPLVDFATIGDFVRTQLNRTQVPLGPVFSDPVFWTNFTNTTNKNTLTEGIIQNFLLAQDISGQLSGISFLSLSGTPTGFESGKFLVANETGLEWTDIEDPVLSFTGLSDTPTGFESGKFLVANETGLEWTGISFTDLTDTPTGYDDGKILQSTTDGLEWVDMPAGGGGGSSPSNGLGVIGYGSVDGGTATFAHKSDNVQSVTRSAAGRYTITLNTALTNYNIQVNTRGTTIASAFITNKSSNSFDVVTRRLDHANTAIEDVDTNFEFTLVNEDAIIGGGGSGGSSYEFCKAHIDSNVRLVDSAVQSSVNVNVDPNNLTQGSQDWTHDAGNGIIGLRPPEDGHYNIEGFIQNLGTVALNPSWATVRTKRCFIQKLDISTNTFNPISERTETKDSGNDGILTVEFNEPNIFLTTNDVIFVRTQLNSSTTNAGQFPVSPGAFISLTKASGSGGSGGSTSAFSKMPFLSTDRAGHGNTNFTPDSGSLATGAENWIYHDTTNNLHGLRPTSNGYYNIDVCVVVNSHDGDSSSFGANVSYAQLRILKRNIDDLTTSTVIARDRENKGYDQGGDIVTRVNESYVYLTTKDVIYASHDMWAKPAGQSHTWGIDRATSYISLSPSAAGGGGGGGSIDGGFIHAVFDGNANIVSKSSEWDTYVNNITFPQGSWNGYAQINYKNSFTQLPTVLTTAGHDSPDHFFSQVHDQQLTHAAIITSIRGGSTPSQQAAPFSVTIFSDEIAGGGGAGGGGGGGGSSTFEDLTDTPSSFIGESGKFVKVNDTEDALEFTTFNVNDALGLQEVDGEDNCSEFHLQSDKTTNSSAFEDSSVNNYSILGSNVIHSTSNPKAGFGSSSIQFNGNGQLLVADGSSFKFFHTKIIKNYTIQLWIFKDALNTREPLLLTAANNNEHGIRLIVDSDNKVKFDVMKGLSNATGLSLASTSTVSAQTWHHVAIVNENNTMSLYLDGNQEHSLAWTSDASTITPNFGLSIGAGPMGAGQAMVFFNGSMQDIRIDKIAFRSDLLPPTSLLNATCDPSAGKSNIDFKMLRDTPVNYSNAGGKYVKVKDGEDGVEFVEISVGSSTTNEFSTAYVTQDQTSDGLITDLEFGNLVIGRTYRISSTICFESNSASALSRADFYNGNKRIVSLYNKGLTSTVSNSMLFIASDNSISVSGNGLTANNFIQGLPELSFVQLELPPSVVVEIEDIPVAPVAPPGGGIFSVNDVKMHAGIIDFQDHSNTFSGIDPNAFGGSIIDIRDVRAISRIDNTGDQKVFEDFDPRLTSLDQLALADVRMITQIDNTGQVRTFQDFRPDLTSFGVLSFTDMSMRTKIYASGASDPVQTADPYIAHSTTSNSWTGIN